MTGAIIVSRIGDIRRFSTPEKLVAFSGLDPVIYQSGRSRKESRISKRGDYLLRYAIYKSALAATRLNSVIQDFYQRKVRKGMPNQKAIVAASRKMCHIIWFVWHNSKPFEVPERPEP